MSELKIEYVDIKSIKPYKKNARKHPKASVDAIKQSIEEFGMCDAIAVWGKDNIIVEGHGRLKALKELGREDLIGFGPEALIKPKHSGGNKNVSKNIRRQDAVSKNKGRAKDRSRKSKDAKHKSV